MLKSGYELEFASVAQIVFEYILQNCPKAYVLGTLECIEVEPIEGGGSDYKADHTGNAYHCSRCFFCLYL
jgi:hypothetical protein